MKEELFTRLDRLRYDMHGVCIDASGSSEGADEFFDEIVSAERERIIGLLQPYADSCENGQCDCLSAESVIALIKGETK